MTSILVVTFWSRAAQALAPRVEYCDLEIICNLVLVIWDLNYFGACNLGFSGQSLRDHDFSSHLVCCNLL